MIPSVVIINIILLLLPLLNLCTVTTSSASIWESIKDNETFSILRGCIKNADPFILALLDAQEASSKYTLFAPTNEALRSKSSPSYVLKLCNDATQATTFMSYLISPVATALPYINQPFLTLLGGVSNLYAYSISKDASTRAELPSILYINNAKAMSWEAIGTSFLVPLDSALLAPPGNGSIWESLQDNQDTFSRTASLIAKLPDFKAILSMPPDLIKHKGYYTFFAPDNEAWSHYPADRLARLQDDPQALQTLLSFHTLSNPKGDYPRSTTGIYYSEQFFPTTSFKARDIYEQFYRSTSSFDGLRLMNDLGILLEISKLNGALQVENASVTEPDIGAYNGVVHRLNRVLPLPEPIPSVVANPPSVLSTAGNFTILSRLINEAAGPFSDALKTGGPFTILAPTDQAFKTAFDSGRLPPLEGLVKNTDLVASILEYLAIDSSQSGLYLFRPDPYSDPFKDDFPDGAQLLDGQARKLFIHRKALGSKSMGKYDDKAVFINGERLYQCTNGLGWGHDCGSYPSPSNTYAINDDHIVNMVHAIGGVLLPPRGSLWKAIQADKDLSQFAALLASSNLASLLEGSDAQLYTIFAPINEALDEVLASRPWLAQDPEALAEMMQYHIVPELWYSRWMDDGQHLVTLAFDGAATLLLNASSALRVNRFSPSEVDQTSSNGVLHKLSGVLVPDVIQIAYASAGLYRTVVALEAAGAEMMSILTSAGPITLFGPVDQAYEGGIDAADASLTPETLKYHLGSSSSFAPPSTAQGMVSFASFAGPPLYISNLSLTTSHAYVASQSGLYVNQAEMSLPVHKALNGLVYPIDLLLQPPQLDVFDLLRSDSQGVPFADLLTGAGLEAQLRNAGPWTIFAPRRATLEKIYRADRIWSDKTQLTHLLSFHIVEGSRLFSPLLANVSCQANTENYCDGPRLPSLRKGLSLASQVVSKNESFISTTHGAFAAPVVQADLHATNGVVHLIDGFLTYDGYRRL